MHEKIFESWRPYIEERQLTLLVVDICGCAVGEDCAQDDRVILSSNDDKDLCCSMIPQFPLEHVVMAVANNEPKSKRVVRCGKVPYLLSGCIAILRTEPCVMCAMALLHSRIDAVVYYTKNSVAGALGSCCSLHEEAGLNHEFLVYQVKPNLEANKLL
jgi:tRNA(Arg) A34 adenosine deaminase TadA